MLDTVPKAVKLFDILWTLKLRWPDLWATFHLMSKQYNPRHFVKEPFSWIELVIMRTKKAIMITN